MTTISRRAFLRGTIALGASAVLYQFSDGRFRIALAAGPETRQLRLVHTNDHHSRIEPVQAITIARVNNANVTRNLGGVARRKTIFDQIRAEATGPQDKLFLDAGDVFQGTLYFNLPAAKGGQGVADLFFYNRLGYHAQAIGNHEFDLGDQPLANYIANATFPIVAANMVVVAPSPLAALYQEEVPAASAPRATIGKWGKRTIVTLPSGEKVGIFGLTTVETKNIASPSANVSFDPNYATIANAQAALLRAAGCKTVVALTHIGFEADKTLAAQLKGVNIIVGGHSHTPLLPDTTNPQPFGTTALAKYPQVLADAEGNTVVMVQDWEWAKWVGDLVIGFDAAGLVTSVSGATIKPVWADGIAVVSGQPRALLAGEGAEIAPDAAFQSQITTVYKPEVTALGSAVVGTTTVALSNTAARAAESALGNLLADALRAQVAKFANPENLPVVAILNGGGIRTSKPVGTLTVGDILEIMPFGNTVASVDVTGAQLKAALENGVSALQPGAALEASRNAVGTGRFANVAGMRYVLDPYGNAAQPALAATASAPAVPARPGSRILKVEVQEGTLADGSPNYKPLDLAKKYRVATLSFVTAGGDGYFVFTAGGDLADPAVGGGSNRVDSGLIDADVVQAYIRSQPNATVSPTIEGRITLLVAVRLPMIYKPVQV